MLTLKMGEFLLEVGESLDHLVGGHKSRVQEVLSVTAGEGRQTVERRLGE